MENSGPAGGSGAGRYAPSPSGALHLGNLRTAMLAWLFARSSGRRFLMRIEDVDRGRDSGAAEQQLSDLALLGLDWDGDPVYQTARREAHEAALASLAALGLVYECYCTRREILEAPSAPHAPPGAYPGTCRNLGDVARAAERARIAPRRPSLRLRAPEGMHEAAFDDLLLGRVSGGIDDFVLQRGDGAIAYNLAVVVDDADMGVDQIVRGDDLASSTPRQMLLQRLLGLPTAPKVQYAHVPLVLGPGGARLAKRDGAVTLADLAEQGIGPDAVRSLLASSLGLLPEHSEPASRSAAGSARRSDAPAAAPFSARPAARAESRVTSMELLLERFDPASLPRRPWVWRAGTAGEPDPSA